MSEQHDLGTRARQDDAVHVDRGTLGVAPREGLAAGPLERAGRLAAVFGRELVRGVGRGLLIATALLPAIGVSLYVVLRTSVESFAVAPDEVGPFVLETLRLASKLQVAWAVFAAAAVGAAQVPRDLQAGALLLYFTRPVERIDYVLGRALATAAWLAVGLVVPFVLVWLGLVRAFAFSPGVELATQPWLFWPMTLLVGVAVSLLQAAAIALFALGVGAWFRNATGALLSIVGLVGGSVIAARVLVLLWGRDSLVGALDLHAGLLAPMQLLMRPLDPVAPPAVATLEAAIGLGLWLAFATLGWFGLSTTLEKAPLGRGRA